MLFVLQSSQYLVADKLFAFFLHLAEVLLSVFLSSLIDFEFTVKTNFRRNDTKSLSCVFSYFLLMK